MKVSLVPVFAFLMAIALAGPAHPAGDPSPTTAPEPAGQPYAQGEEMARQGKWEAAAALFGEVAAADAGHYQALNMLGYSLRQMGRTKEAIAAYDKALSIRPDYAPALEYRGVAHVMAGDRAAALADLRKLESLGSPLAEDLRAKIASMPTR